MKTTLYLVTGFAFLVMACGNPKQKIDNRPPDLKRLIAQLDTAEKRFKAASSNELKQDEVYKLELLRVNQFIKDSLDMKVKGWPGVLRQIKNEDGYVSFEVQVLKNLSEDTEYPEFYSIILTTSISKKDEGDIKKFMEYKEADSVHVSGSMVFNEQFLTLHKSYTTGEEPFSNPVIDIICEDIELIKKRD